MRLLKDLIIARLRHDNPTASLKVDRHENPRHALARLALIVCECRRILVNDRLERINEAHRDLDARNLLAEVELADLRRLIRVDDDKTCLVHDNDLPRAVSRHL